MDLNKSWVLMDHRQRKSSCRLGWRWFKDVMMVLWGRSECAMWLLQLRRRCCSLRGSCVDDVGDGKEDDDVSGRLGEEVG